MYVLRTYCYIYRHTYVVARSIVNIQHSIGCLVVFSCYDVITCQSSMHTFRRFFCTIFLFLTFLNIHIYFIILKTYDQQFTFTTKKSLHIIFKQSTIKCLPISNKVNIGSLRPVRSVLLLHILFIFTCRIRYIQFRTQQW